MLLKSLFLMLAIQEMNIAVKAAISLYGGEDCYQCIIGTIDATTTYKGLCRSQFGFTTSYCCTEDEADSTKGRSFTCQNMPLCSWDVGVQEMAYLACPHEKRPCGISNPNIRLNLGESRNVKITVKSAFGTSDSCFYTLSTYD